MKKFQLPNNDLCNTIGSTILNTIDDIKNFQNKVYDASLFDIAKIPAVQKFCKYIFGILTLGVAEKYLGAFTKLGEVAKMLYEVFTAL